MSDRELETLEAVVKELNEAKGGKRRGGRRQGAGR